MTTEEYQKRCAAALNTQVSIAQYTLRDVEGRWLCEDGTFVSSGDLDEREDAMIVFLQNAHDAATLCRFLKSTRNVVTTIRNDGASDWVQT